MEKIRRHANNEALWGIQALRALAALLVLIEHVFGEVSIYFSRDLDVFHFPWPMGVDLFFVISGYIMYWTNWREFGVSWAPREFLLRRVIRIVPLYYLATSLIVAVLLLMPSRLNTTQMDVPQILSSYLFWPYMRYDGEIRPVLSLGWTLNYEVFFYAIFAVALFFPRRVGMSVLLGVMMFLVLLGQVFDLGFIPASFWTNPIILEFCAGAALAALAVRCGRRTIRWSAWFPLFSLGFVWAFATHAVDPEFQFIPRVLQWGGAAFAIAATGTALIPSMSLSPYIQIIVKAVGDSSYALYLFHRFIFRAIVIVWGAMIGFASEYAAAYLLVASVASIAGYYLVHRYFEVPVLRRLRRPLLPGRRGVATSS